MQVSMETNNLYIQSEEFQNYPNNLQAFLRGQTSLYFYFQPCLNPYQQHLNS